MLILSTFALELVPLHPVVDVHILHQLSQAVHVLFLFDLCFLLFLIHQLIHVHLVYIFSLDLIQSPPTRVRGELAGHFVHLTVAVKVLVLHQHLQEIGFVILQFLPLLVVLLLLQSVDVVLKYQLLLTGFEHTPTFVLRTEVFARVPLSGEIDVFLSQQRHKPFLLLVGCTQHSVSVIILLIKKFQAASFVHFLPPFFDFVGEVPNLSLLLTKQIYVFRSCSRTSCRQHSYILSTEDAPGFLKWS